MNIKQIHDELKSVGIPITGFFKETEFTDPGLEIDGMLVLQFAKYNNPPLLLDVVVGRTITEACSFQSIDDLIQFLMES